MKGKRHPTSCPKGPGRVTDESCLETGTGTALTKAPVGSVPVQTCLVVQLPPGIQPRHRRAQPKLRPHGRVVAQPRASPIVMVSAADHLEVPRHEGVIEAARPIALAHTVGDGSLHIEPVTVTERPGR